MMQYISWPYLMYWQDFPNNKDLNNSWKNIETENVEKKKKFGMP